MYVSRVAEMRALDRAAIDTYGMAEELLMENAGHAAYDVLAQMCDIGDVTCLIFCGVGNNGGDGFVVARKIHSAGGAVKVYVVGDRNAFKGAAKSHLEILCRLPIDVQQLTSVTAIRTDIDQCDVIVDAMFGTGLSRQVEGQYREVIACINAVGKPVLSLDIPSGVHGDTGQIMGMAVQADYTVTFGLPKVGNLLYPGYALGGKLYLSHISFPPSLYNADSLKIAINQDIPLPIRDVSGHKGDFGDVLFIAGAASYFGAPYLSAFSFMKAGGGYARLAAPAAMIPFLATKGSEIVYIPQDETPAGSISLANKAGLLALAKKADMVVLGPGLSLEEESQQLAREVVRDVSTPLLLDGDGLTALCQDKQIIQQRQAPTILTPHMGEMARLTGLSVQDIQTNRVEVLQQTANALGAYIVLKGAHSLIGYPDECVFINMSGNSGMATAGAGDVLTGTIAAMFGLGLPIPEAVRMGVFIHGLAGDLAAAAHGEDGLTAQDILMTLPRAVQMCRHGLAPAWRQRYVGAHLL
jgi:NAD(P)H-hydrate epimerase